MMRTVTLDRNQKPTEEQIKQIREAAKNETIFDEGSPELTTAMEKPSAWLPKTEIHRAN